MILFRTLALLAALAAPFWATAQKNEKAAVKAVIQQFFLGMSTADSTLMRSACTESPMLQTVAVDKQGNRSVRTEDFQAFVRQVGTPSKNTLDERIKFGAVHVEEALASVWTPYEFYLNGTFSHCGTNSFQLVKIGGQWKIQYIIDTRRKACK
ncbi:MAG: nuclear transport factor 2 family protein [Saprospiraceae bacterium]